MKRRQFFGFAIGASAASLASVGALLAQNRPDRELYELQLYHLRRGPMQKRFDDFMQQAAIPALNRAGVLRVGVFDVVTGHDNPTKYVLLPYPSPDVLAAAYQVMVSDPEVIKSEFFNAAPTDPSYIRVESSLMLAFEGMPRLEVPKQTSEKKPRLFELRIYESHSKKANLKKIEMFNEGEIAIFRKTGLTPVFFGETLIGNRLPNLTYMLVFSDMQDHDHAWKTFVSDPEWKKLSTTPGYTDPEIVSNISNAFLRPTSYSQI
ncbi:MAG: NIPSNAP family protein [Verrucomicrobiae bacterium]|nr:NIPSNAP family protein [Verrucomicrobiae bacterium]